MNVLPRLEFVDVLSLQNQGQWLFVPRIACGECKCLFKRFECVVIIAAFEFVRGAVFGMAPNAVFKHFVPDVTTTSFCFRRIFADLGWV
ncbi:MAG: hypothetical protein FD131_381 [Rhodocyclaceae bacterium]|nr:MAG: hypothetical protein FD131_381 [Rhodocyclaceae bacterium]